MTTRDEREAPAISQTLNIVGSGQVGTALGLVLAEHGVRIRAVLNRRRSSSELAVARFGSGQVLESLAELPPADLTLIATNDDNVAPVAQSLAEAIGFRPGDIVFHCSGASPADLLAPLRDVGAAIACLHPMKSFTDPLNDAADFAGTPCALDGDPVAVDRLQQLFARCGAECFRIESAKKRLYHASAVFSSNYLHVIFAAALKCLESSGVPSDKAPNILRPIMEATLRNTLAKGPGPALTGPIARGDLGLVAAQYQDLAAEDLALAQTYASLGRMAVELARQKAAADPSDLDAIAALLGDPTRR